MPFHFIEHDRRLKVAKAKALPPLPVELVLSDEFEPTSVCRQMRELARNKVGATRQGRRSASL